MDLIITQQCDALVKDPSVSDYHISDHWSVTCLLNLDNPIITRKTKTFRKIKNIDTAALSNELGASDLCSNTADDLNKLVHCYNTTLVSALDCHALLVTRSIPVRPLVPWFNNEIKKVRKERRNAERRWRRTGLLSDLRRYKDLRNKTNNLMTEARRVFYREHIDENCGDQKRLFSVTKRLLGSGHEIQFPPFKDKVALANKFGEFFAQKIVTFQGKLNEMSVDVLPSNTDSHPEVSSIEPMTSFTLLTEHEVRKLLEATPKKSCALDPMPTPLLVTCIDTLLPLITKIINLSLQNGIFADQWKCALVHPMLKKLGLEPIFQNFRPVSNLQYIPNLQKRLCSYRRMVRWSPITSIQSCSRLIANTIAHRRPCSKS